MKILQQPFKGRRGERVEISFSEPTVVLLIKDSQYKKYQNGMTHHRIGGYQEQSPVTYRVPTDGVWHAVIEKGGHFNPKHITGSIKVLPPEMKTIDPFADEEDDLDNRTIMDDAVEEEEEELLAASESMEDSEEDVEDQD